MQVTTGWCLEGKQRSHSSLADGQRRIYAHSFVTQSRVNIHFGFRILSSDEMRLRIWNCSRFEVISCACLGFLIQKPTDTSRSQRFIAFSKLTHVKGDVNYNKIVLIRQLRNSRKVYIKFVQTQVAEIMRFFFIMSMNGTVSRQRNSGRNRLFCTFGRNGLQLPGNNTRDGETEIVQNRMYGTDNTCGFTIPVKQAGEFLRFERALNYGHMCFSLSLDLISLVITALGIGTCIQIVPHCFYIRRYDKDKCYHQQ